MAFPDTEPSILVVGGGPAGLATASALSRKGLCVSVVERSDYRDIRIGEHVAPSALQYLSLMGFPGPGSEDAHLCSSGVDAWWGGPTANHLDYMFHPAGHGFNLSRPFFDASLAARCREDGAAIFTTARLVRADWKRSHWVVTVNIGDEAVELKPTFIIDATGRSAAFARAHGSCMHGEDRQIAVVAVGGNRLGLDDGGGRILIEAAETGWWYFATLSSGGCVCMFVTDANLLPTHAKARLPLWWKQQVQGTSHIRSRFGRYGRSADPIVRCARSQRLDRFVGIGWIAIGDAAMAFDPLSSRGIGKAVEQGHLAANAIAAHLSGDREALRGYSDVLEGEYRHYRRLRVGYYSTEVRWPDAEFWHRRHTMTEDGPIDVAPPG